ncbi:hypothetical protein CKQ54_15455 [Rahnella variigena]|uniref:Uncharacterized protein n=1 Tax=Rahnella variigena TaxID=574964 RepID=A0ABX9PYR6_9GAMM|nr:hypothetical protein D6D38_16190 [Rahnella variigena]RKF69682.1 hypothetical protein CKQ54_15455 [Rahnella variigena]
MIKLNEVEYFPLPILGYFYSKRAFVYNGHIKRKSISQADQEIFGEHFAVEWREIRKTALPVTREDAED